MALNRFLLTTFMLVLISIVKSYGQLPEPKPVYIDSSRKLEKSKPALDSVYKLDEPQQSAPLILLLEKPGRRRIGFGVGSPITYYVKGDNIRLSGIVVRVEREAIYVNSDKAGKQTVPLKDIQKIVIPNTSSGTGLANAASIGLGIGSISYLLLSVLNPGEGNAASFSNPRTLESFTYAGTGLAAAGLLQLFTRDKRIRPGGRWKYRVDEYNSFYGPIIQQ